MSETKENTNESLQATNEPSDQPKPKKPRKENTYRRRHQTTKKIIPSVGKSLSDIRRSVKIKIQRENDKLAHAQAVANQLRINRNYTVSRLRHVDNVIVGKAISNVIDTEMVKMVPPKVQKVLTDDENVAFRPNPGPQTDFLAASEKEVLYGGARGGGKSYAMLIDPLRYFNNPNARALLLRRTMPEVRDLIHKSQTLYKKAYPKAVWREQEKEWRFPSGARMEFGYCETASDVLRYQGQAYTWIGIDELGQFADESIINDLSGSLRSIDPSLPTYMRFTANPGGPGHAWIKRRFIDPSPHNKAFSVEVNTAMGKKYITRRYIPAKLTDNPYLVQSEDYMIALSNLPEHKRRQWLDGDWDATEGSAFPEFDRKLHVVAPFEVPRTWPRFRAGDWGYSSPACVLWFAADYDNTLYVYREYYGKGLNAEAFARRILELEAADPKPIGGIMDSSLWAKRGDTGPSIIETMAKVGCMWRPSDRSAGSRISGKLEVHRRLALDASGQPKLKIFSNCTSLISTLPTLPLDDTNPEDVDTRAEDHAYDALRYGVMSRPLSATRSALFSSMGIQRKSQPADAKFGY